MISTICEEQIEFCPAAVSYRRGMRISSSSGIIIFSIDIIGVVCIVRILMIGQCLKDPE